MGARVPASDLITLLLINAIHDDNNRYSLPTMSRVITPEQFSELGKLEQLFHNRYLNAEFLHQLVSIYVKAIEYFNQEQNFLKIYFMEKMQFVVSRPEVSLILEGKDQMAENIRETVRETQRTFRPAKESPEILSVPRAIPKPPVEAKKQDEKPDRFVKVEQKHHHHQQIHNHYNEPKNLNKGKMKLDHQMKVMREVEENKKNIQEQVKEAELIRIKNQEKIKNIEESQDQMIKKRLENRKKRLRKKSVEIKANINQQIKEPELPAPAICKQQLIQAQRELTAAIYKLTVRLSEKPKELEGERSNAPQRMKRVRDDDEEDEMLLNPIQELPSQEFDAVFKKKSLQGSSYAQDEPQARIKTTRKSLDSDDEAF